jgi:hypothetical protein
MKLKVFLLLSGLAGLDVADPNKDSSQMLSSRLKTKWDIDCEFIDIRSNYLRRFQWIPIINEEILFFI